MLVPMNIVASNAAMIANVVAAFLASGGLNAGIPFEIASVPVNATQPFENAPSKRNHESG